MKKFKCENCEHCKLIDSTGRISCNYLFNNGGCYQPKYCPNYKEKKKNEN